MATIAVGLMPYLPRSLPWAIERYRLTNRRVSIEQGISPGVTKHVTLDAFDAINLDVSPGLEWFVCGAIIFRQGPIETLRLAGVGRPEPFRRVCREARHAYFGAAKHQAVPVGMA